MNKRKFLALAVATAIAGITMLGATSATSDYMHYQDGTISICDPDGNGTKCITMQDKNLGATEAGLGCTSIIDYDLCSEAGSSDMYNLCIENLFQTCIVENGTGVYGNHYQRGNNNGFLIGCWTGGCSDMVTNNATLNRATWDNSYNNYGYNGGITNFMKGSSDYWDEEEHYDGLLGGVNDSQANNRGYDEDNNVAYNVTGRKGPCEDGYHVPSIGEWSKVLEYWAEQNNIELDIDEENGLPYYDRWDIDLSQFGEDFKLPHAGYRYYETATFETDNHNDYYFWSSSPISEFCDDNHYCAMSFVSTHPYELYSTSRDDRANGLSVRCFKDEPLKFLPLIEPTDSTIQVTIGETEYNELPDIMEVSTEIEEEIIGRKPVVGEVKVDFGENVSAKFNKLVQINIPVEDEEQVIVKVKHEGSSEYNFDGLTLNRNATCNDNGRPTSSQYNGTPITVVNGFASIYTCEASSFIALGLGAGEALGEVTLTLTAGENTCTLQDYNLGVHNVSSEDQNVSTSGQNIVCEFLKNPGATIQLSMGDLVDGTKEIGRQYFTGIVTSLGNSLGTIANLTGGSYNFLSSHVIYTKEANTIGTWTGSLAIEGIIPAGTPSGEYTGELNVIICEGC